MKVTVCDPENFQIPLHQIATYSESKIEFLECGASGTLLILPIDITNAIKNPTFKKCLDHFRLLPSLIENGKWASVRTGEIVQANSSFVIWALSAVNNINCFQTLETQINDTQKMVLKSLIWAFPKSEMFRYDSFLSLVRSWLADNVPQRYRVVVCDPNMSMPTTASAAGKWPRGRAHHRPSPILQNTPDSVQVGLVRGRGCSDFYEPGGRGGHTSTPSTTIYTEAFKSIVSRIVSVVQMAQAAQPPQTAETYDNGAQNVFRGRGRPPIMCHKCKAFGHIRQYCPNNCPNQVFLTVSFGYLEVWIIFT